MAEELDYSRVERMRVDEPSDQPSTYIEEKSHNRPAFLNFIAMLCTAIALDIGSIIPVIGDAIDLLALIIFIPWFYFSGMTFTNKRIGFMSVTSILEALPVVQMAPFLTINIITAYWINGN